MYDLVLTETDPPSFSLLAHQPGCPLIAEHRAAGRPIVTMIGIERPVPEHLLRHHECLGDQ